MLIIVPSRARPARALQMVQSAILTANQPDELEIVIVIDDTDPELDWYRDTFSGPRLVVLDGRHRYTEALNVAAFAPGAMGQDILGAFGDDVLFRTQGWDDITRDTLRTPGLAFGDDMVHSERHPTAIFMSRLIVDALGWLALPATKHQWADDAWMKLGKKIGRLRYMPDVVIEHMHPAVGKAEWDQTYRDVIGGEVPGLAKADFEGFEAWHKKDLAADARRVKKAIVKARSPRKAAA